MFSSKGSFEKSFVKSLVASLLFVVANDVQAETYFWGRADQGWQSFDLASNWMVGDDATPARVTPSATDMLGDFKEGQTTAILLSGDRQVKGISSEYAGWGRRTVMIRGATLEFLEDVTTHYYTFEVHGGGKLVFGRNCATDFEWGGAKNVLATMESGTEIDLFGEVTVGTTLMMTNATNAKMVIDPLTWNYVNGSAGEHVFSNNGTMEFPSGFTFGRTAGTPGVTTVRIRQDGGTMVLGGTFAQTGDAAEHYVFELNGGTLMVANDVSMAVFKSVGMPTPNGSACISVSKDCTLDWANASFAEGTSLAVEGEGSLILGAVAPTTLALDGLSRLVFVGDTTLQTLTGYEDTTFAFDETRFASSAFRVVCPDAAVRAKLVQDLGMQARGWTVSECEDAVVVCDTKCEGATFFWQKDWAGWAAYADPANWKFGEAQETATRCPGECNWLSVMGPHGMCNFDLGGRTFRVKGLTVAPSDDYTPRQIHVAGGTLEFTEFVKTHYHTFKAWEDGKIVFGRTCTTDFEWGGAKNVLGTESPRSEIALFGTVVIGSSLLVTNAINAKMVIDPLTWNYVNGSAGEHVFSNNGTMEFPSGLTFGRTAGTPGDATVRFRQDGGTMVLGGTFAQTGDAAEHYVFELNGGTLMVTNDVSMAVFKSVGTSTPNGSAYISVAKDCTLDWANASFAEGTSLTVDGEGELALGALPSNLFLGGGIDLRFARPRLVAETIHGLDDESVSILLAPALLRTGTVLLSSADDSLLSRLQLKMNARLDPNRHRMVCIEGDSLVVRGTLGVRFIIR